MDVRDFVRQFNKPPEEIKKRYPEDYTTFWNEEKTWLGNLDNKLHLLKGDNPQKNVGEVIEKLKNPTYLFDQSDANILSVFTGKINGIVRIANRINNFKEGVAIEQERKLKLFEFFNAVKASNKLDNLQFPLNANLDNFLPHIYSVIKHAQDASRYPVYYKYWKNINREVLQRADDYDSICEFYRTFPENNRQLHFATYLGTIGTEIAKEAEQAGIETRKGTKDHKYLVDNVINIERYIPILEKSSPKSSRTDIEQDDKWKELVSVVQKIGDESAVRKFFNGTRHVLTALQVSNSDHIVYASAIKNNLQFTIGSRYVLRVKSSSKGVIIGFYLDASFLDSLKNKYPQLQVRKDENLEKGMVYIDLPATKVNEADFFDAITSLAKQGVDGQSTSQFRSMYEAKHNPWIVDAALDENVLNKLFLKYFVLGSYWDDAEPKDQTLRFLENGIWENGWDDKFYDEIKAVPVGSKIAIKAAFVKEKTKSVMAIKARGEVVKNPKDGKQLSVKWEDDFAPFEVGFSGGYWATIKEVTKAEHIKAIWELNHNGIPESVQVFYAYLKESKSHRKIEADIMKLDFKARGGGFKAMAILHEYDIESDKKGILNKKDLGNEMSTASGKYLEALKLIQNHYPEFSSQTGNNPSMKYPLNTILYGPPGTGKTYQTVKRAAEIIAEREIDDYDEALKIFRDNLHNRIEFITFHQNYSYEDFIQGLRPDVEQEGTLSFERSDGVFKKISDKALENLKLSDKAPEEVSREALFDEAIERLAELVQDSQDYIPINDSTYIMDVDDSAFRYSGANWVRHQAGIRMKFSDLKEFYLNNISDRKQIKSLLNISQLAKQHATYYLLVYKMVLKYLPKKASIQNVVSKNNYVIVIDEINRANISRVFGELITLIEPDKRSHGAIPLQAKLPSGDTFIVPSNLYIIGTMNTADKSIALLDIALRRRFEFEAMYPKYEIDGTEVYDAEILRKINKEIIDGKGHDFQIGHAYFMGDNKDLIKRMNKKVIPLLLEYYMNDEKEVTRILGKAGLMVKDGAWPLEIVAE